MVFPVVMYVCESWTIKNAEHQRIDAFELWCWRRPLRVPCTARTSNQSILKEISPEYSLEGLMLKLKLQYFHHLMWRAHSLEKTMTLGKTEGRKRRGQEDEMVGWHHRLNGHEFEQTQGDSEGQGSLACYSPWGCKESDMTDWLNSNITAKLHKVLGQRPTHFAWKTDQPQPGVTPAPSLPAPQGPLTSGVGRSPDLHFGAHCTCSVLQQSQAAHLSSLLWLWSFVPSAWSCLFLKFNCWKLQSPVTSPRRVPPSDPPCPTHMHPPPHSPAPVQGSGWVWPNPLTCRATTQAASPAL